MTPQDLLDIADEWSDDDREAAWRGAAHSAYFAAFHAARNSFRQLGFRVPNAERAHAYLWIRLQNCGNSQFVNVGGDLYELRTVRNEADYDIHIRFTRKDATAQVALAIRIVELLDQATEMPETLAQIVDAMRIYERDVLRETTWQAPT